MFARDLIEQGETIVIWGGQVFSREEIDRGVTAKGSVAMIAEGVYLGAYADAPESIDDYMNHSCDSNCWMSDEVTVTARRDIKKREEVTIDYALFSSGSEWKMENCNCGSPECRGTITGNDWKLEDVRSRYRNHFSPFLNRRIELE